MLAIGGGFCLLVLLPAVEAAFWGPGQVNAIVRAGFSNFCHQDPSRSIVIAGAPLPVCTRCSGIYFGGFLGWALWHFVKRPRRDRPISGLVLLLGYAPIAADGALNTVGLITSPGPVRFLTGLIFGAVSARAMWPAMLEIFSRPGGLAAMARRDLDRPRKLIGGRLIGGRRASEQIGNNHGSN